MNAPSDYAQLQKARSLLVEGGEILRKMYGAESARDSIVTAVLKVDQMLRDLQVQPSAVKWEWTCRICQYVNYVEGLEKVVRCGGCGEEFPVAPG